MGGEKHLSGTTDNRPQGSPPRGRGKVALYVHMCLDMGITPAWAGKSFYQNGGRAGRWDHPRVGGEKKLGTFHLSLSSGSPPRGRGKVCDIAVFTFFAGITPAWAGKSATSEKARATRQDHPRVGGEKQPWPLKPGLQKGSPPRGRGKAGA